MVPCEANAPGTTSKCHQARQETLQENQFRVCASAVDATTSPVLGVDRVIADLIIIARYATMRGSMLGNWIVHSGSQDVEAVRQTFFAAASIQCLLESKSICLADAVPRQFTFGIA
jgi:hypothetical protein